jgi:iron complex transport system ATP-binding protein
MILSVDELEFLYRNRKVLHQIAFSIEEGEVVAILGPNGVGKTTLLKCLNKILRPKREQSISMGTPFLSLGQWKLPDLLDMFRSVWKQEG